MSPTGRPEGEFTLKRVGTEGSPVNTAVERLRAAVQANCHVTDARHARNMTLCTYLLEMRELYRWERGAPLATPLPRAEIGAWIARREALWESLEDAHYQPLPLEGQIVDPWDADTVNRAIAPLGLVYGAGVGRFGKPQFFLGRLARQEQREGMHILVAGHELARDLSAAPAAMRGGTVTIRLESLARVLAERTEAWAQKRHDGALKSALDAYGCVGGDAAALERMAAMEAETLILHELGEREAGRALGPGWEEMLSRLVHRRAEVFVRAARDHLADCLVTLPALLGRGAPAPIHSWFAGLDGMRREIFPRAVEAYASWRRGDGARALTTAIAAGAAHWQGVCSRTLAVFEQDAGEGEVTIEAMSADPASRL
jgi:hypothetical protein